MIGLMVVIAAIEWPGAIYYWGTSVGWVALGAAIIATGFCVVWVLAVWAER
jgi:hypothetical protein